MISSAAFRTLTQTFSKTTSRSSLIALERSAMHWRSTKVNIPVDPVMTKRYFVSKLSAQPFDKNIRPFHQEIMNYDLSIRNVSHKTLPTMKAAIPLSNDDVTTTTQNSTTAPWWESISVNDYEDMTEKKLTGHPPLPSYLVDNYSWAYVNPTMIRLLDHKILVNMVLLGQYTKLCSAALDELSITNASEKNEEDNEREDEGKIIEGRTLQAACVYADLTERLSRRLSSSSSSSSSSLDVVDVVPDQLKNVKRKLNRHGLFSLSSLSTIMTGNSHKTMTNNDGRKKISLTVADVERMPFEDKYFDNILFFFLLHELPNEARVGALEEAHRVLKPGGKIVFIDYHQPTLWWWRMIAKFQYDLYEPFAMDMWTTQIEEWLPEELRSSCETSKDLYLGGLFQKFVVRKIK